MASKCLQDVVSILQLIQGCQTYCDKLLRCDVEDVDDMSTTATRTEQWISVFGLRPCHTVVGYGL